MASRGDGPGTFEYSDDNDPWLETAGRPLRGFTKHIAADQFGGAVVVHTQRRAPWLFRNVDHRSDSFLRRLNGATGALDWEQQFPEADLSEAAIGYDGTVYVVESTRERARLIGMDGETGAVVRSIDLGYSEAGSSRVPANTATPIVLADGTLTVAVHRYKGVGLDVQHQLQLVQVDPDGLISVDDIQSEGLEESLLFRMRERNLDRLIPDDSGAFLLSVSGIGWIYRISADRVLSPPLDLGPDLDISGPWGPVADEAQYIRARDALYVRLRHQPLGYISPWNGATVCAIDPVSMSVIDCNRLVTASDNQVPPPPDVQLRFANPDTGLTLSWDSAFADQFLPTVSLGLLPAPTAVVDAELTTPESQPRPNGNQQASNQVGRYKLRVFLTENPAGQEDIIRVRLLEIEAKLKAEAEGPNPTCSAWLRNPKPEEAVRRWDVFLPEIVNEHRYVRGIFRLERSVRDQPHLQDTDSVTAAINGRNPGETIDILPAGILLAVNDIGAFYKATDLNGQPYEDNGRGSYGGNNPRAQAEILLHELAHLTVNEDKMPLSLQTVSFKHDLATKGNDKNQAFNRKLLDRMCGQLIRTFPK